MARIREQDPAPGDDERNGYAHYERVAPAEVRFIGWCPNPPDCGRRDITHSYKVNRSRYKHLRVIAPPIDEEGIPDGA